MLQFDEETAARFGKMYEAPYAVERRRVIRKALAVRPGEGILDVGCGPGFVACEVAESVGASGMITGVDSSATMLALATARAAQLGFEARSRFLEGDATRLPVPDAAFDGAVISQVYEYVADIPGALRELHRALKPGGRAVIFDTDWDSVVCHSSDHERMQRVLKAWEGHLADPFLPRTLASHLDAASFEVLNVEAVPMFDSSWAPSGLRHLTEVVRAYVPGHAGVSEIEAEAWFRDLDQLAARNEYFFCVTGFLFSARRR
jgi:ubiquinone/menaquinone biosynthesis C-methylase UbiE